MKKDKKYHYVYNIKELSSNRNYIGVRSCNCLPEQDLGIKYFSSSTDKEFIVNQKINPANYKYEILSLYETKQLAINEECRLHELYNVDTNSNYINRAKNTPNFNINDKIPVKDINDNIILCDKDDERFKSGELVGIAKNKICVKDPITNKHYQVNKDDPRYISGELVFIFKDMVTVKDQKTNITRLISKYHPDYISKKYVPIATNTMTLRDKNYKCYQIDKSEYDPNIHIPSNKDRIACIDNITGKRINVYPNDKRLIDKTITKIDDIDTHHKKDTTVFLNLITKEKSYLSRKKDVPKHFYRLLMWNNPVLVYEYKNMYYFTYLNLPQEINFELGKSLSIVNNIIPDVNSEIYKRKKDIMHIDRKISIEQNSGKTLYEMGLRVYELNDNNFEFDLNKRFYDYENRNNHTRRKK